MLENEEFFMSIDIKMAENAIKSIIKKATEEKKFSQKEELLEFSSLNLQV